MLMVKTRLGLSEIAGIGLFADQDIPMGTETWRFMNGFDQLLSQSGIESLPEPARSNILDQPTSMPPAGSSCSAPITLAS